MKKYFILLSVVALLSSCNCDTQDVKEDKTDELAVAVNLITISDLQSNGADYINKEIRTQGIVDHVCRHSGKKILLVADDVSIHVMSEERFDENIGGKEIILNGIVKEDRTDEASLLQLEEDAINSHSEDEEAKESEEALTNYVNTMRDSLASCGVDHFSDYYMELVSYEEVE
jgi:hypothetical protein